MIFRRKKYLDIDQLQTEFLDSIKSVVGLDQLLNLVSSKLKEILGITSIYPYLFDPITQIYYERLTKGDIYESSDKYSIKLNNRLVKWFYVNQVILDTGKNPEVLKYLSKEEINYLIEHKIKIIVPLFAMNQLTSIFFLGEKLDNSPYKQSEIKIIETLAGISALAIEYAASFKFQEDRLKKLLHSDKLMMVGELAAGTAHEIRNPLTAIKSTIQYLQKDLPEEKWPLSQNIVSEIDRIDKIIKGLLSFSKRSELKFSEIELEELLNQIIILVMPEIKNHHIELKINKNISEKAIMWGDISQLKQVFLNILLNSIQAIGENGEIKIEIYDFKSLNILDVESDTICFMISDNGKGIDTKDLPRVFEPFFSTKNYGTGLGLSISYGIIKQHNGDIEIKSISGIKHSGTNVIIKLPKYRR